MGEELDRARGSRWTEVLLLMAILAAGVAARLYRINEEMLWYDEYYNYSTLCQAESLGDFLSQAKILEPAAQPVYYTVLYIWSRLVGTDTQPLRLLSVILGMVALLILYVFTKRLYNRTAGCCALLLGALSNIHIFYSQETRVYALVLPLSLWAMYSFHRAQHGGSRLWGGMNYAASFVLVFTHFFGSFLLVAQGVYLLIIHRGNPRRFLIWTTGHVPAVVAMSWWLSTVDFELLYSAASWVPMPGTRELLRSITWDGCYLPHAIFQGELGLLVLIFVFLLGWRSFRFSGTAEGELGKDAIRKNFILLCAWLVIPPLCLFLFSQSRGSVFILRYVLYSSYALFIMIGAAIATIRGPHLRIGLIALLVTLILWHCISEYRPFRPNYESCARQIEARIAAGDRVLVYRSLHALGYLKKFHPALKTAEGRMPPWQCVPHGRFLWAVYNRVGRGNVFDEFERDIVAHNCHYERIPISVASFTFLYICTNDLTLDYLYPTTLYRIWSEPVRPDL